MNDIETLPRLIEQAMAALENATTAAEVLDARDQARVAYDAAKSAARFTKAKSAHATILATCHRMQADALTIEARAQSRLADEYNAAQERGEVAKQSDGAAIRDHVPGENKVATVTDIGLTRKQIHDARQVHDAENREPGVIRKMLDAKLDAGEEPTRADVKRLVRTVNAARGDAHAAPDGTVAPVTNGHEVGADAESDDHSESEIAPPEVIVENILYTIDRINENARVLNKFLKMSVLDREAVTRINNAIDGMIKKWRSIKSTLEKNG
jgi:hypothetical protein